MDYLPIRCGDNAPAIRAALLAGDNTPINLAGAAVTFSMQQVDGAELTIDAASASIIDDAKGIVEYAWQDGDTGTAGAYECWFAVEINDTHRTFPNDSKILINITD